MKKYDMRLVVHDHGAEPEAKAELYIAFDGITASQLQTAADMAYDQLDDLIRGAQPCKDCDASPPPPTWRPKEITHESPSFVTGRCTKSDPNSEKEDT